MARVGENLNGFIRRGAISHANAMSSVLTWFAVEEKIDAMVTYIDPMTRKLSQSIKAREVAEEKQAMADFRFFDSGASLGDILGAALAKKESDSDKDS